MADIIIEGIPSAENALKLMEKFSDQIPFATANAVNSTLGEVQSFEVQNIKDKFTTRKEWYRPGSAMGVNRTFAKKTKLVASVFTRAPFMERHEDGGVKTPRGNNLAIPQRQNLNVSLQKAIPLAKRPKAMLNKPRTFIAQMKSGKTGIWQRLGNPRLPIRLLYAFAKHARIKQVLFFRKQGYDVFMKKYQGIFGTELAKAIATRKP